MPVAPDGISSIVTNSGAKCEVITKNQVDGQVLTESQVVMIKVNIGRSCMVKLQHNVLLILKLISEPA